MLNQGLLDWIGLNPIGHGETNAMLGHAAILADTKVRHYFLTETFDAWESWDVIHHAQERLRWGIWAFSHAAVKKPEGLKMPSGSYISWCNQGVRTCTLRQISLSTLHKFSVRNFSLFLVF